MTPGPTIIRKCSICGELIAEYTINSGNTFGARFWTDGKTDAPMLPDAPWLVKCKHCEELLWIDEQEQIGKIEPWGILEEDDSKFKDALPPVTPSLQDYFTGLSTGVFERRKERYLRLRIWWAGNDMRRDMDQSKSMSDKEISNLRAFMPLLDETNENDRIMKAEAMRELGMFEEANALLTKPFSKELAQAAAIISDLTGQKVSAVREMRL